MFGKKLKIVFFTVLFIFISNSLFAVEEYVSDLYRQLDTIFTTKSEDKLNSLLAKYSNDKYYYLIENYTQKKIRRLIVNNEYDFAMTATLAVIENNLDNEEAVEMYSVISDAYEIQRKHEQELEQKRQLEIARIEAEKEKQRGNVEKEYVAATKTEKGAVYVSGKETKLTHSNWKISMGLVDALMLMDKASEITTFHYGISADYRYEYTLDNQSVIGADVFAGVQFMGFAEQENLVPMLGDAEVDFKAAFPQVSKNLFFRFGFEALIAGKQDVEFAPNTAGIVGNFYSPLVGVKFEHIQLGNMKLDLGAEWLAGHLFQKDIKLAAGGSLNLEFPFAEMEKVKLNMNIGLRDKLFLKNSGIENRASVILAIGVENVIR